MFAQLRWVALIVGALVLLVGARQGQSAPTELLAAAATSPTLSVGVVPTTAAPGESITISAIVTPGTDPASTSLSVVCDLSWAGLSASAPLFDDGMNGDVTAGDNTFTRQLTVPAATVPGVKAGSCGVSDAEGRSGSNTYSVTIVPTGADAAPGLSTHTPASDETNVPIDSNIGVTFSEPVNVIGPWFTISCSTSGAHTAGFTGTADSYVLDPNTDFANNETCTVTIAGAQVSDQDANDPPDTVEGNPSWSFTTEAAGAVVINETDYDQPGTDAAEFLELRNNGSTAVQLSGYAVDLVNGATGAVVYQTISLPTATLAAGDYYVICANNTTVANCDLDVLPDTNLIQNGAPDAIALRSGATIVDRVSYEGDTTGYFEGTGAGLVDDGVSATVGISRCPDGTDTDRNNVDFRTAGITPGAASSCPADEAPSVTTRMPAANASDVAVDSDITIGFSEPVDVTGSWFTISCVGSGTHTAAVSGGPTTFTLNPDTDFATAENCTVTVLAANVTDQDTNDPPNNMAANASWTFATVAPPVRIHDIQGAAHTSPKVGQPVSGVVGIVTAKRSNGFYMQDPSPDADDATSEGIFVFTSSAPGSVNVGDAVRVSGNVAEFRPGGVSSNNLSTTEITGPTITVDSTGNPLPPATVVGSGGRVPPTQVIENDAPGNVEIGGTFDPAEDGIDFYESLEAMRVQVNNPVVVGPRNSFGEVWVLGDNGAAPQGPRTSRGGIVITPTDFNPERIQLDDAAGVATPNVNVGDHFTGPLQGVLDYDFGNYEIELTSALTRVADGVAPESTAVPAAKELSVATFNVENLDALEPQSKFDALAGEIVTNMKSPDVISLEEIQDNNGAVNDSIVDATETLSKLIAAIQGAGGPTYDFRQINPVDDQDGGEPGGNIRVGFLFRTDRGLAFVDRPGGGSTTDTTVVSGADGPELSSSPGRIAPTNAAWNASRKPLAGEFTFHGQRFFLITNHFNSKGGDQPLFGRFQPPTRSTEVQRHQQAQLVNDFVDAILAVDANANVIVLGDLNDFEFSQTVNILEGGVLHTLMKTLPPDERYSYVFEGNSQSLDHIAVSNNLFGSPFTYDPVHVNAEFFDQLSDHDPQVARFVVSTPPTVDAGGPYTVAEGSTVLVSATGADADGDALTYAWDLDDNGSFETAGQTATFSAVALDGPASRTIHVRVSDGSASTVDDATVEITNVAPQASFSAPASVNAGFSFLLRLTSPSDPSTADTAAGFTYAFDCGNGYGVFGAASTASCPTSDAGTLSVGGKIRDKDGDVSEYRRSVSVVVTFLSLCDLVKSYTSDGQLTSQLCQRLDQADKASSDIAKRAHLATFRDLVEKSSAFTAAQKAVLIRLAMRL